MAENNMPAATTASAWSKLGSFLGDKLPDIADSIAAMQIGKAQAKAQADIARIQAETAAQVNLQPNQAKSPNENISMGGMNKTTTLYIVGAVVALVSLVVFMGMRRK